MNHPLAAPAPRLDDVVRSLRLALCDSPDSAFVLDRERRFLMANPALCDSLRASEPSLIGRRFELSARTTDPECVEHSFRVALGVPIIANVGTSGALRAAWEKELAQQEQQAGADPRALADALEKQIVDPAQKKAVATLRTTVEDERSRRVQADEREGE